MYTPRIPPTDPAQIPNFLTQELRNIAAGMFDAQPFALLAVLHKEPTKLRDGMVVCADGTDWDPGSGAGFYGYSAGSWTFLG